MPDTRSIRRQARDIVLASARKEIVMFVVVQHDIMNADTFFGAAESVVSSAPEGLKTVQFFPSNDQKKAVCLWEAPSVDSVKDYLEAKIGSSSKNTYYAVNSKMAMGLPVSA
jgi:hypothetical protein